MDRKPLIQTFLKYNSQLNLSAIRDEEWVYTRHILDSLELINIFNFKKNTTVIDVGTGWWFPLLPLATQNPNTKFVGIDARRKKVDAVNHMIQELSIPNAKATRSRIEEFKDFQWDYIIARSVAYIDKLMLWIFPLLRSGWYFCLYKQESAKEAAELKNICKRKKIRFIKKHTYKLADSDLVRVIYILQKR